MMKRRPFISRELARQGPAVPVTPVLIPVYRSDLSCNSWWVFSHLTDFVSIWL